MGKLLVRGMFLQAALLIIVLLWLAPARDANREADEAQAQPAATSYRTQGQGTGNIVQVKLDAVETEQEIAPGVSYHVWTFGGTAPGPVIRVTEGDTVRFTLTNKSSLALSHSIDFHAAQTPWDVNYVPVAPGDTLSFGWVARFPGVFMYHCGVPPVLHHIANGMYGAIIVEPKTPLPAAREYVLVSSEFYPGEKPVRGMFEGDIDRMTNVRPGYVVFNGVANQYMDAPLVAKPNEPIRIWVMNAGPTLTNAFHVIGALFDHVYPDGNPTSPMNGIQTWSVPPGGGAMFELSIPDRGLYPFVTHSFAYTGLGSVGVIKVAANVPDAPSAYPAIANPFDGGLTEASGTVDASAPKPADPAEEAGGGGSAAGTTLEASITGFTPSDLDVKEQDGKVSLTYVNLDPTPHDFTIDELGVKVVVGAKETRTVSFEAGPGTYTFICSIPGHRESGMEGTISVLPGMAH